MFLAWRGSHETGAHESHQNRGQTHFCDILVGLWDFLVHSGGSLGDSGRLWETLGDSGTGLSLAALSLCAQRLQKAYFCQ